MVSLSEEQRMSKLREFKMSNAPTHHGLGSTAGYALALGLAMLASTILEWCARGDTAVVARLLHASLWLWNGLWLVLMAVMLYLWEGRRGLHHLWWPSTEANEANSVYLALCVWMTVVIVGGQHLVAVAWGRRVTGRHTRASLLPAALNTVNPPISSSSFPTH